MQMPEMLDNVCKTAKDDLAVTIEKGDNPGNYRAQASPRRLPGQQLHEFAKIINVFEIFKLLAPNTNVRVI